MESCAYLTCSRPVFWSKASESESLMLTKTVLSVDFGVTVLQSQRTTSRIRRISPVRASTVDSSADFVKRMEQTWLISQQPKPVVCSSCNSEGHLECKWCAGTGFFILGENMLCQVPSRNTSCVICAGKGSMSCSDCKGTGFRAKWLDEPPIHK